MLNTGIRAAEYIDTLSGIISYYSDILARYSDNIKNNNMLH